MQTYLTGLTEAVEGRDDLELLQNRMNLKTEFAALQKEIDNLYERFDETEGDRDKLLQPDQIREF